MTKRMVTLVGSICLVFILAVLPLVAWAESTPSPSATHPMVKLEVLGGKMGAFAYILGIAEAEILSKNIPWIKASGVETVGTTQNIVSGSKKDPNSVLMSVCDTGYWDALDGKAPFKKKYNNVRFICGWTQVTSPFITLDPEIKTVYDFVGKRVHVHQATHGQGAAAEYCLRKAGVWDKIKVTRMGFGDAEEALSDGLIYVTSQCINIAGWVPSGALAKLIAKKGDKLHYVNWPHEIIKQEAKDTGHPHRGNIIPAGTLPGQTEPVECWTLTNATLACFDGMDEDMVYKITKTMAENCHTLGNYHPGLKSITPESMVELLPVASENEVHPGALRYYKEMGLWKIKKKSFGK